MNPLDSITAVFTLLFFCVPIRMPDAICGVAESEEL